MTIKGIIFDVDGTLADTEEIHRQAFNEAFKEFGIHWHWNKQEYIELLAISGGRERMKYCLTQDPELLSSIDAPNQFVKKLHQRKSGIYREKLRGSHIQLRPGVKRLIHEAIEKKICLGIATSSSKANLLTLLHSTLGENSISWFSAIVTNDTVVDKKPSPAAYQCALATLGIAPEACIAIEDTSNGNKAALASGLKTIITTHQFTTDSDFTGASLIIDKLGEADAPFSVQYGNAFNKRFVDVELLELILNESDSKESSNHNSAEPIALAK